MDYTLNDFIIQQRASGWCVIRSDGAMIAIGFPSKTSAQKYKDDEIAPLFR